MRSRVLFAVVVAAMLVVALARALPGEAADKPEPAATKSAESWLALVDQGKYADSWDAAATLFRAAVTRDKWAEAAGTARTPFGKLVSRKLKSAKHATSLPGAPDGNYVVIQYATTFEHKKSAIETITPMQEADGTWKVSGYFIK